MENFLGEIRLFPIDYAPTGWTLCDGRQLTIQQNQALYALIGNTFGGDLRTYFNVPDLRGRVPIGYTTNPAVKPAPVTSTYAMGANGGAEGVALTQAQIPPHNHAVMAQPAAANLNAPTGAFYALPSNATPTTMYGSASSPSGLTALHPQTVGVAGANASHDNMQPSLVLGFYIATTGIWPSRD